MTENSNRFTWIPFYEELAGKLLAYKDKARRGELLAVLQNALQSKMKEFPRSVTGHDLSEIDPFTVFGFFNTQDESNDSKREARVKIAGAIKEVFTRPRQHLTLLSNVDGLALLETNKLIVNAQDASGFPCWSHLARYLLMMFYTHTQ